MSRELVEQYFNVRFRCGALPATVNSNIGDMSEVPGYDLAVRAYEALHRIADEKAMSFPGARVSASDASDLELAAYELCEAWPEIELTEQGEPYLELPFYSNAKLPPAFVPAFEAAMRDWLKQAGEEVKTTLEFVDISSRITVRETFDIRSIHVVEQ